MQSLIRPTFPFVLLLLLSTLTLSQELMPFIEGRVVGVIDGDSLIVQLENGKRFPVRLQGIAAPEKRQSFGIESRRNLSEKLMGKDVKVHFRLTDKLGRVLGKIVYDDEDVALAQLAAGLTWYYTLFINELTNEDRVLYQETCEDAKKAKVGLWKDASPVSPWAYRASNKIEETVELENAAADKVIGNKRTKFYLKPNCVGYKSVPAKDRVLFTTDVEAERAGYRLTKGCR